MRKGNKECIQRLLMNIDIFIYCYNEKKGAVFDS